MKWGQYALVIALAAIAATSCENAQLEQTVLLQLRNGGQPAAGVEVGLSARSPLRLIKPVEPEITASDGTFRWRHRMIAYKRSHEPDSLILLVRRGEEMRPIWSASHTEMSSGLVLTCDLTPRPIEDPREMERRQLGLAMALPAVAGCSAEYERAFDEIAWLAAFFMLGFSIVRVLLRNRPDQRELEFQLWGPGILCFTVASLSHRWWFGPWFTGAGSLTAIFWMALINWQLWRQKAPAREQGSDLA